MPHKLFYSFFIFFLIGFSATAQKKAPKFHSVNQAGAAAGENSADWVFQSVNGIEFLNYFVGIGVGIDQYRYKTLPLFFDARAYFAPEKRAFIYGDLGYNFPMKNMPGKEVAFYNSYHFTGGIYTDLGIGYQFKLNKQASFLFSFGHSYKKIESKIGLNACGVTGPCWVNYSQYKLGLGRMMVKAGLVF